MCFFFSFVPATGWPVIGFVILFATTKTEGSPRTFGRLVGMRALVISWMFPITGDYGSVLPSSSIRTSRKRSMSWAPSSKSFRRTITCTEQC